MTGGPFADAAAPLRELMSAVVALAEQDSSLTLLMWPDRWEVGVDAGPSVDDVLELVGDDLAGLLTEAAAEVRALPQRPLPPPSDEPDDVEAFLAAMAHARGRLTSFPLDVAFVPRSRVSPDCPWEVTVGPEEQLVVSGGATGLEALVWALEQSRNGPAGAPQD